MTITFVILLESSFVGQTGPEDILLEANLRGSTDPGISLEDHLCLPRKHTDPPTPFLCNTEWHLSTGEELSWIFCSRLMRMKELIAPPGPDVRSSKLKVDIHHFH